MAAELIAHALIEEGTLKVGEFILAGGTYAKVRNLDATTGKPIKSAGPSTPVIISGFKTLPEFGDQLKRLQVNAMLVNVRQLLHLKRRMPVVGVI